LSVEIFSRAEGIVPQPAPVQHSEQQATLAKFAAAVEEHQEPQLLNRSFTELRVGTRLGSAVCTTEIIVIRTVGGDIASTCGGEPMVAVEKSTTACRAPTGSVENTALLGKRYWDGETGIEILVTKAGLGPLAVDRRHLVVKEAKKLPSSD
jgi:hypothetical protein